MELHLCDFWCVTFRPEPGRAAPPLRTRGGITLKAQRMHHSHVADRAREQRGALFEGLLQERLEVAAVSLPPGRWDWARGRS